jgi:hypothetical protein
MKAVTNIFEKENSLEDDNNDDSTDEHQQINNNNKRQVCKIRQKGIPDKTNLLKHITKHYKTKFIRVIKV